MAKKSKDEVPNPNSITNRDIIQRLNFLYQASVYLHSISSPPSIPPSPSLPSNSSLQSSKKINSKSKHIRKVTTSGLAKSYINCMKCVGQKTTVKIDPAVKRTICKTCNTTLLPGCTASVRVKKSSSHGHAIVYICASCNTQRRIPAPPILIQTPEATNAPQDSLILPTAAPAQAEPEMATAIPPGDGISGGRTKRKKAPIPRVPPLFARDVGHIVYCGNERVQGGLHGP